ncbi:hypothetical protein X474_07290 [Dethiosulfatarculus sandiegensis]|uniref:Uncharacterized protein n=1 Tax=Dethiosulfatarculus sandiegensis TaxID=1429043 RepID=A0A0D2JG42_9BACT|nr:hypothetical protein X474_07290 [Dethiosulfatarculus sandiegensis]
MVWLTVFLPCGLPLFSGFRLGPIFGIWIPMEITVARKEMLHLGNTIFITVRSGVIRKIFFSHSLP